MYSVCNVYSREKCGHKYFSCTSGPGSASTIYSCNVRLGCPAVRSCRLVPLLRRPQYSRPSAYPLIFFPFIFVFHTHPPPLPFVCLSTCLSLSLSLCISASTDLYSTHSVCVSVSPAPFFPPASPLTAYTATTSCRVSGAMQGPRRAVSVSRCPPLPPPSHHYLHRRAESVGR